MVANLAERYAKRANLRNAFCEPLAVEDFVVQSMPDASPTGGTLAHTTWFFETFVLARREENYWPANADFQFLFNSTTTVSASRSPARRGLSTRPTVAEVFEYRHAVDQRMARLLNSLCDDDSQENGQGGRTGNQPRTAASRADAHRPQARLSAQSALADVSAIVAWP